MKKKRIFFGVPQDCFSLYEVMALCILAVLILSCAYFEITGPTPAYLRSHGWLWFFGIVAYCAGFGRPLAEMGTVDGALTKQCTHYLIVVLAFLILGFISIGRITSPPLGATGTSFPIEGYYIILIGVVSAMVLGLGWLIQFSLTAKADRRKHTIRVLLDSRMSGEFQKQVSNYQDFYRPNDVIKPEDVKWFYGLDSLKKTNNAEIKKKYAAIYANSYLINFYEFLAVGIRCQDLDEGVLKAVLQDIAINLHGRSIHVIAYWRDQKARYLSEFVDLVNRWKDD